MRKFKAKSQILLIIFGIAMVSCNTNDLNKTTTLTTTWGENIKPNAIFNEYPRPGAKRAKWMNLCGYWDFTISANQSEFPKKFQNKILVPFAPESHLSGIQKSPHNNETLWYKKEIRIPKSWDSKRVLLNFEAVIGQTTVYINNTLVGEYHSSVPFNFDITDYLKTGKQEILVSVDKHAASANYADNSTSKITGIWQPVWLEPVPDHYIKSFNCIPDVANNMFKLSVKTNSNIGHNVNVKLFNKKQRILAINKNINNEILLPVNNPILWSPENPFLYDLVIELTNQNGEILDKIDTYAAMRSITIKKDNFGTPRFYLNNKLVFQFGIQDYGWWPDGLLTPPSYDAMRYDIDFILQAGFNTVYKYAKYEPRRFYHYCDQKGVMVWQDIANAFNHSGTDGIQAVNTLDHLINYPSIFMWIANKDNTKHKTHFNFTEVLSDYDPSRLINSTNYWKDLSFNAQFLMTTKETKDNATFGIGEFDGLCYSYPQHSMVHVTDSSLHTNNVNVKHLKSEYEHFVYQLPILEQNGLSAVIYKQTTDITEAESGLLTCDRKISKIPLKELNEIRLRVKGDFSQVD